VARVTTIVFLYKKYHFYWQKSFDENVVNNNYNKIKVRLLVVYTF